MWQEAKTESGNGDKSSCYSFGEESNVLIVLKDFAHLLERHQNY